MEIVNIICSGNLNQKISFSKLSVLNSENFRYDPDIYHGAYLIINGKKITIYSSGKYIFIGLKSKDEIVNQFKSMKNLLKCLINTEIISKPVIQNIVVTDSLGYPINLQSILSKRINESIEYEPEQFPGLIYRTTKGTSLLFGTGKMVISGLKKVDDAKWIKERIQNIIDR